MAEIIWSERAIKDLEQIGDYISSDSVRYANMVVQKLFNKPKIVEKNPFLGRMVPEFRLDHIRELIEGPYRIVYSIKPDLQFIEIITIHHSKKEFLNIT
jgi:toxin ParE1/3/4